MWSMTATVEQWRMTTNENSRVQIKKCGQMKTPWPMPSAFSKQQKMKECMWPVMTTQTMLFHPSSQTWHCEILAWSARTLLSWHWSKIRGSVGEHSGQQLKRLWHSKCRKCIRGHGCQVTMMIRIDIVFDPWCDLHADQSSDQKVWLEGVDSKTRFEPHDWKIWSVC